MQTIKQLIAELQLNGIADAGVLKAIKQIPREAFMNPNFKNAAYENAAFPIDCEQTISQPYIVALMTQALVEHRAVHKILEIGTGSGYQTAILAVLFEAVYTIERIAKLSSQAKTRLTALGLHNVFYQVSDGAKGWDGQALFDSIIVTAAATEVPQPLLAQLDPNGGRMIIPVGQSEQVQNLTLIERCQDDFSENILTQVRFVPLIIS